MEGLRLVLNFIKVFLLVFCIYAVPQHVGAQGLDSTASTVSGPDSTRIGSDSMVKSVDTLAVPEKSGDLDKPVDYSARDSIVLDVIAKKAYLYGDAHVTYGQTKLDADSIQIDLALNEIYAQGRPDSTGKIVGSPVFTEGKDIIKTRRLAYSLKTKKGIVYDFETTQGEGLIRGEKTKFSRDAEGHDVIYIQNARYSTCDLPHQHFYLSTTKMKLIPQDKVITGPAFMVIEDLRIPIIIPFGFFPADSRKSSGIIIPTFGETATQGFALRKGGFYFGNSPYFDVELNGDIYTNGTYRIGEKTRYAKRYKFTGGVNINYAYNNIGLKETPEFTTQRNYNITWTHQQDPRANPGTNFGANVDIGSSDFLRQNTSNVNTLAKQQLNSSISFGKTFANTPFSLTAAATHDQSLSTGALNVSLPEISVNVSRISPFRSRKGVNNKWYHDINFNYRIDLKNRVFSSDTTFLEDIQAGNFVTGATHILPLATSVRVLKYFTLNPSITYNGYIYDRRLTLSDYDTAEQKFDTVLERGVYAAHTLGAQVNLSTILYGMASFKGKLRAIRHVMTPILSAQYNPDYGRAGYGYYNTAQRDSTLGGPLKYFVHQNAVVGGPGQGEVAALGLRIDNVLDIKVADKSDTVTGVKKIRLIDGFDLSSRYNFVADSQQLSKPTFNIRTTLLNKYGLQAGGTFNPYELGPNGETKNFAYNVGQGLGKLSTAYLNFNTSLNSEAGANTQRIYQTDNPLVPYYYPDNYANFNLKWNVNIAYNLNYFYSGARNPLNNNLFEYKDNYAQNLGLTGEINITERWKLQGNYNYDLTLKQPGITKFTLYRDLHCWQFQVEWIPTGPYRAYFFNIHVKAPSLRDLKYDQRKEFFDYR